MVVFTLNSPATVGTLDKPVTITALELTGYYVTTTPPLAQIGTGLMQLQLTETTNRSQVNITYQDASVLTFIAQPAPTPQNGETLQDITAQLVFAKLVADGKLPAGTITTTAG